jgi:hypothetical protein
MTIKRVYHKDGTLPKEGKIWVFGSNLAGIHGAGAARVAVDKFGARFRVGVGPMGSAYAIPTKDQTVQHRLPLETIEEYVNQFIDYTDLVSDITDDWGEQYPGFFVTRVGCGLAGFEDKQIAPMFKKALNCSFAEEWKEYLEQ